MEKQHKGKLIVSVAKTLKGFQLGDPTIASYLYATLEAGRLGLFASAIRSESHTSITRIRFLAAEEGIGSHQLTVDLLPWLERAGLCDLVRAANGDVQEVTSLLLAYRDLLNAVSDFYDTQSPSDEDLACLLVLSEASELPKPESMIRQAVATAFSEDASNRALQLAKLYGIVATSGNGIDPLLYAPRVWATLHEKAPQALSGLNETQREVLLYLMGLIKNNQGYPESLIRDVASRHGAEPLIDMAIGIGLMDTTAFHMSNGGTRRFLTTPHFYSDMAHEFGEDMFDRVKIFLDSIRNGQYFGASYTGKILSPVLLLRALLDRGRIGPATAIARDYTIAEKTGIIRVQRPAGANMAFMELGQEDTVRKVLEIVSSGTVEPGRAMSAEHISSGTGFGSIEQDRAERGKASGRLAELEDDIMRKLREA